MGAVRLRSDSRCWLRSENLLMDSRLREASDRNELVLLKSPVPSSPWPVLKKLSAPWRDRRTFPTHPCIWVWATEILSPKYSMATVEAAKCQFWEGFLNPIEGIRINFVQYTIWCKGNAAAVFRNRKGDESWSRAEMTAARVDVYSNAGDNMQPLL